MRTRIISGAVLLALVGLIAWVRGPLLVVAILGATAIAAGEFYSITRAGGFRPWFAGGVLLAVAFVVPAAVDSVRAWIPPLPGGLAFDPVGLLAAAGRPGGLDTITLALTGAGLLAGLIWTGARPAPLPVEGLDGAAARPALEPGWIDAGLTVAGAIYTGGILQYALRLTGPPGELWWILLVVLGTAAADSGAYFVGRLLGRRKLIPHISPNKTWAGFWGGLAFGVLAVVLLAGPLHIPAVHILPLGLGIGLSSVAGDLCESLLKRSCGVKDSGHLIPGHGGLLDRLDSIFFVLLVVYSYMQYFYA